MKNCKWKYYPGLFVALAVIPAGLFASCDEPVVINDFHAAPGTIYQGKASTLEWNVSGTNQATLNNGIGSVVAVGTAIVTPEKTTRYVLTAGKGEKMVTREITVTVSGEEPGIKPNQETTGAQGAAGNQETNAKWVPVTLRYDNLKNTADDYLANQIAVWHTYAKLAGAASAATSFYSNNARGGASTLGSAGVAVKSPMIILPERESMVCIIRNYSQVSYRYFELVSSWYGDSKDEDSHLAQAGYGLATLFSPGKAPFKIQKINMAAVARHSGTAAEYNDYHFIIRILNEKSNVVWSKSLPWSYYMGEATTGNPMALWKSIDVDNAIVSGDFTVEVLSESDEYAAGRNKTYHYLAVAYEESADKDDNPRSFISDNGTRADSWMKLYDAYGHSQGYNLCIRVEGSGQEK